MAWSVKPAARDHREGFPSAAFIKKEIVGGRARRPKGEKATEDFAVNAIATKRARSDGRALKEIGLGQAGEGSGVPSGAIASSSADFFFAFFP